MRIIRTHLILMLLAITLGCTEDVEKNNGIILIEDAAEALGSKFKYKFAGTIGDLGIYSFQATKTITTGEGGAVVVNEKKIFEKLKLYRSHGVLKKKY